MKKIVGYLKLHIKSDFNPVAYLLIAILLTIAIRYNYQVDFEDSFLDLQTGFRKVVYFFLFFSLPFYTTLIILGVFKKDVAFLRSTKFWMISSIGFFLQAFDSSALFLTDITQSLFPPQLFRWGFKVSNNYLSLFIITLPLLGLAFLVGRKNSYTYGLNNQRFDTKPYFIMLAIMIPFLFMASFLPGFSTQYPMFNSGYSIHNYPQPEFLYAGIYELGYGLNFISVELFFRGFLVIGLMSFAGRKVVLAMAVSYCFLHFGKPAGEAISSIFGGYLLGVIAYETKSIWGGVIIHVGIAWAMEIIAVVNHTFQLNQ